MENILLDRKKRNVKIVGKLFCYHSTISNVGISENEIFLQILD